MRQTNRLVEKLLDTLLQGFVLPHTKTTVLQDWIKGRRSEVDELNGLVVVERERARLHIAGQHGSGRDRPPY